MKDLKDYRIQLDTIDEEMKKLFLERMKIVEEISAFKKQNNLNIEDKNREQEMCARLSSDVSEEYKSYYLMFLNEVINISKSYQKK